jgi:pimeloyl-ACP methyl ester carboxylesterase
VTARALRRFAHTALGAVAPGAGARLATDVFSSTRTLGLRPDNVLPLGARHFTVHDSSEAPNGYLWGEQGGTEGTALLVHGWASDSSSMYSLVAPLRELGLSVAAFDAPAHGVRKGSQATMTQYTRAVRAVLDTLGDVRVIVAHSLGTIASIGAAVQRTVRRTAPPLDCLVAIAPACTLGGVLERWDGAGLRLTRTVVDGIYRELHLRNGVPVSHWDAVALGMGLDTPVLAVHDPGDPMVPYSDAKAVAAGLRHVTLEEAPGTGHAGILTDREVKALVSAFVSRNMDWNRNREGIS